MFLIVEVERGGGGHASAARHLRGQLRGAAPATASAAAQLQWQGQTWALRRVVGPSNATTTAASGRGGYYYGEGEGEGEGEGGGEGGGDELLHAPDPAFYYNCAVVALLVLVAGAMAGATMNLTGLDPLRLYLRVLAPRAGAGLEKEYAKRAHAVTSDPHLLLVTLLLCNAGANEALPIFLGRLVDPLLAVVISVTCVLFFGEIIPSAICLNPATQLRVAACAAPFVQALIFVCRPIAWPIAKLLDGALPHGPGIDRLSMKELTHLVLLQKRRERGHCAPPPAGAAGGADQAAAAAAAAAGTPRGGARRAADRVRARAGGGVGDEGGTGLLALPPPPPSLASTERGTHVQRRRRAQLQRQASLRRNVDPAAVHVVDEPLRFDAWAALKAEGLAVQEDPQSLIDDDTELAPAQAAIIVRLLELRDVSVTSCMTRASVPRAPGAPVVVVGGVVGGGGATSSSQLCMLSTDDVLDLSTMGRILEWGMSRLPVHAGADRDNIVGYLLVKRLIRLDPDDATPVSALPLRAPLAVAPSMTMFQLLDLFQSGKAHLAVVSAAAAELSSRWRGLAARAEGTAAAGARTYAHTDSGGAGSYRVGAGGAADCNVGEVLGLITLEDVVESLIGEPIDDEDDYDQLGSPPAPATDAAAAAAATGDDALWQPLLRTAGSGRPAKK